MRKVVGVSGLIGKLVVIWLSMVVCVICIGVIFSIFEVFVIIGSILK